MPTRTGRRQLIGSYLRPQRADFTLMAVLLICSIGGEIAEPLIVSQFIETAQFGDATNTLIRITVLFLAVAVGQRLLTVLAATMSERVAWTATNALRLDLTAHVLGLDLTFHESRSPGELIERIDGDTNQIAELFSTFVVQFVGNCLLLLGVLVTLAVIDPRIGLAALAVTVAGLLALRLVQGVAQRRWLEDRQQSAVYFGYVSESLKATEDIRSSNAVPYAMNRLSRHLRTWAPVKVRAEAWGSSIWVVVAMMATLTTAIAFAFGSALFRDGTLSLGQVYLVFAYATMIASPMEKLRQQFQYLQLATAAVRRVGDLLATPSALRDGDRDLPTGPLSVAFENVSFTYAADAGATAEHQAGRQVLRNLTFHVEPGRTLGLVGRTGAGKTTIARLLFRMYDPQQGEIRLGGVDLSTARITSLRSHIGFVTQDVHLFSASLRDNLTFFDPAVPDRRLLDVLHTLHLDGWLAGLSDGLDTPISTGGLSAGQAQLVALARVFLEDPGLVILDEPSSKLDPATGALLEKALDTLLTGRTAIVIAHRLETIHRAADVLVLADGEAVEYGPIDTLLADPTSRLATLHRVGGVSR